LPIASEELLTRRRSWPLLEAGPDHLVLGCCFAGRVPVPVLAAAGKNNDVFTFNTYPCVEFENVWSPNGTCGVVETYLAS
jgi:hypothetical protein